MFHVELRICTFLCTMIYLVNQRVGTLGWYFKYSTLLDMLLKKCDGVLDTAL
jgi:hypothetical protein